MSAHSVRHYKYYDLVMAGFVTVLICSNLIGPAKACHVFGFTFGAGNLFFPISYLFGDVLTEVYGYARGRRVIWAGFAGMVFASFMAWVVVHMPGVEGDAYQTELQPALGLVFGTTWRVGLASLAGFWAGEFANSFVLAKMKVRTGGRHLWTRTIGSTVVGQAVDTALFYPLAFGGLFSGALLAEIMLTNYAIKVGWEALCTPITYRIVAFLKRKENEDYYDRDTDFSPFTLAD